MCKATALFAILLLPQNLPSQQPAEPLLQIVQTTHTAGEFNGVVIITQNGKNLLSIAVGESDPTTHLANTPQTTFRLASLTKQITALLVMQEVASNRLRLDQPAGSYLTGLSPAAAKVTIQQLLQHVSGLPNPGDGPENIVPPFYLRQGEQAADMQKSATGVCSGTPKREPGLSFEYNNCDYIILGAVLTSVTHTSYSDLVRTRIVQPLGLHSWGLWPADPKRAPKTATGGNELPQNPATYGAAGALYGNALDVAKWDHALLTNKLLSKQFTEQMFLADPKLYGEALGSWSYDLPGSSPTLHLVERQGDIGTSRVLNLLLPQYQASIVILANTERADLFDTYSKKGLGYKLAMALNAQLATSVPAK